MAMGWWQRAEYACELLPRKHSPHRQQSRRRGVQAVHCRNTENGTTAAADDDLLGSSSKAGEAEEEEEEEVNVRKRSLGEIDDEIAALESELAALDDAAGDGSGEEDTQPAAEQGQLSKRLRPATKASDQSAHSELSLHCAICDVRVTSQQLMREHLQGRKHLAAAKVHEARAESRFCEVCSIAFTSIEQMTEHTNGRKHKQAAASRMRVSVHTVCERASVPLQYRGL
mmetsp:Transcript_38780/g.82626  ORF Transcript_38780/g.82626 Transcript_38780/m.82626 type:complete len:228 (-) Transcript_38780:106-789(-)